MGNFTTHHNRPGGGAHRLAWSKREDELKSAAALFSSNNILPLLARTRNLHLGFYFDKFSDALKTFIHCDTRLHNRKRFQRPTEWPLEGAHFPTPF